ncbi:MAG: DUF503 domain-containing protein [candidate division KSB1 bacterium]|nr:DUF503 domain-containing protein [candidate division KSB1 bacterium]MDZ7318973.1 DUF503 domain-containing protein [candidate division KSB1 bacterium]MDZ7340565.1 DUF503 domain-containing protein [candidate division KSB1 bacterium]
MIVGVGQIELYIPESGSLKSKRFVLKSIKTRIRNKFNVSIAEIENNDKWQRATIGVAIVSNDKKIVDSTLNQIMQFIENDVRLEIVDHSIEIY